MQQLEKKRTHSRDVTLCIDRWKRSSATPLSGLWSVDTGRANTGSAVFLIVSFYLQWLGLVRHLHVHSKPKDFFWDQITVERKPQVIYFQGVMEMNEWMNEWTKVWLGVECLPCNRSDWVTGSPSCRGGRRTSRTWCLSWSWPTTLWRYRFKIYCMGQVWGLCCLIWTTDHQLRPFCCMNLAVPLALKNWFKRMNDVLQKKKKSHNLKLWSGELYHFNMYR